MKKITLTALILSLAVFGMLSPEAAQGQDTLRPPAYPLITVDPNFSIWVMQDRLYGGPTRHWTGREHSLQGIIRVDGSSYYFLGQPIAEYKTVLPIVGDERIWQYTMEQPQQGWAQPGFGAEGWKQAAGAFSNYGTTPNEWTGDDLWVRRTFQLDSLEALDLDNLLFYMYHDDNVEVYINGVMAYKAEGWVDEFNYFEIREEARRALRKGPNVLAIHCENTAGGSYLDAGLVQRMPPPNRVAAARQTSARVGATRTHYQFDAGPVRLELTFTAPMLPDDLQLVSRPANYISYRVQSDDGAPHQVELYLSAGANIAVNSTDQEVVGQRLPSRELDIMRVGTAAQQVLGRKGDNVRIDWGYLYLAGAAGEETTSRMAASRASVSDFIADGALNGPDAAGQPRPVRNYPLTLAMARNLGAVSADPRSGHLTLAYDDLYAIEYFRAPLQAWWKTGGSGPVAMLQRAERQHDSLTTAAADFDQRLFADAEAAGGRHYAELSALAYRQAVAAHKLVAGPQGEALFFSKENFSNGSIGTVDVTYPSSPLFLYYNPRLLKGMLEPIFYYTESGRWTKPFPAHDVGTYPIANGQTYGEDMPVEEAGNMLIMTTAIAQAEGDAEYARRHWPALTQWADYLMEHGMDPKNQLSTDDFSGHLARNANLSVKAILGIAGYGRLAGMLDRPQVAERYTEAARRMARKWMDMADAGDHYMLAFGRPDTWSQKYNLVWDHVLGLNVFPDSINEREIRYYLDRQNAYGLPLDNRAGYTKSDWIVWTATLAGDQETFERFITPMYRAYDTTGDRVPMTDWYWTGSGEQRGFQARSVVGGFFMKMLEEKFSRN